MAADMFSVILIVLYFSFCATVVAQSQRSVVCIAGQCLEGLSNTTIGATLSGAGGIPKVQLLPGQYTVSNGPKLLHDLLNSTSSTLVASVGFGPESLTLPLNVQIKAGLAIYSDSLYSGRASFAKVPEAPVGNTSIPLSANSFVISSDVWITVSLNNRRLVLWESVPDTSQLPSTGSMTLLNIQLSSCSCSGPGVCSASGCTCPTGFTGSSCESCADGFFGPTCERCPSSCCDQGITGSGRCLTPANNNTSSTCNCLHGQCGAGGECTCNNGWTTADNGTACAKCIPGFYLSARGCEACGVGCSQCEDDTGLCTTCRAGFAIDTTDNTKCATAASPGILCSDGSFNDGVKCSPCSPTCRTCTGPTSSDCALCLPQTYFFNGNCVTTDSDGICQGTNGMVGNSLKNTCDSCDAKCISCIIPNFVSGAGQQECTRCLPGSFLNQGKCVDSCAAGMFASQNGTCTSCSPSCSTCAGSPDFCLTCPSGQVASSGTCISTCPSDTFPSSGGCIKCHPDCSTCSGPLFIQCNSCPSSRPVLINGRCQFTCPQPQLYFDTSTSTCRHCDPSCSSCSGPGSRDCLACSSSSQVLRGGSCVPANCQGSSSVVSGLGVCLSELVQVNSSLPSGSGSPGPLPTTGLSNPVSSTSEPKKKFPWWQVLLITVGCTLLFLMVIWCLGLRAKVRRENRTKSFAREKNLDGWLGWLGRRLFGSRDDSQPEITFPDLFDSPRIPPIERDVLFNKLGPPKSEVKGRPTTKRDSVDELISSYEHAPRPVGRRRKRDNPKRLKGRIDRNSRSLYIGERNRREAPPEDPEPPLPTKVQFNSEGVLVNRFNLMNKGQKKVPRPTIDGDSGASSLGRPVPTYAAPPPTAPRPIGAPYSDAAPQHPGRVRMRDRYMIPPAQAMPQFRVTPMVSQPMGPYPNAPLRDPFRPRGH